MKPNYLFTIKNYRAALVATLFFGGIQYVNNTAVMCGTDFDIFFY